MIRWLQALGIIALGVIALGFTMPIFSRPAKKGVLTRQLSDLKQLTLAFRMYSDGENGPPKNLAELGASEKYITKEGWPKIGKYTLGKPPKSLDWLYFPERIPENENDEPMMIIASPEPYDGSRLIAWSDGTCRIISEEEYTALNARGGKRAPKE